MAENSNNSNDNGGSDDAILAMLEGNITKATSKAACYAFSDKIKAEKKAIYGRRFRALVAKKSHNAGIFTQSVPRVSSGRAEIEDEVPIGLPRPPEFEQPNAACS